jgi:hypothetical protein
MSDLSHLSVEQLIDLEQLRQRLAKMSDTQLRKFGEAGRYLCSPEANLGKPPREAFAVQLREAHAESKRRHPKTLQRQPSFAPLHVNTCAS